MANEDLGAEIVLALKDQISSELKRVTESMRQSFSGMQKSADDATKGLGGMKGSLDQVANAVAGVTGIVKLLSFAAVVNEMKQAVSESIAFASSLDRMSNITGIGVEKLQKYQIAMKLANVEANEFQGALRVLQLRTQAALEGNEDAARAFDKMGISMSELQTLSGDTDALFRRVVDGLTKFGAGSERAALGNDLLGRSFSRLSPAIKDGTAALDQMGAVAERVGAVLGEEQVKALDNAGDKMELLSQIWTVAKANMASMVDKGIAPAVKGFAELVKALAAVRKWMTIIVQTIVEVQDAIFNILVTAIETAIRAVVKLGEAASEALGGNFSKAKDILLKSGEEIGEGFEKIKNRAKDIPERFQEIFREADQAYEDSKRDADEFAQDLTSAFDQIDQGAKKGADGIVNATSRIVKEALPNLETFRKAQNDLKMTMGEGGVLSFNLDPTEQSIKKLETAIQAAKDKLASLRAEQQALSQEQNVSVETMEAYQLSIAEVDIALQDYEHTLARIKEQKLDQDLANAKLAFQLTGDEAALLAAQIAILEEQIRLKIAASVEDGEVTMEEKAAYAGLNEELERHKEKLRQVQEAAADQRREQERLKKQTEEGSLGGGFSKAMEDQRKQFFNFREEFGKLFNSMESGFSGAVEKMLSGGKKFRDIMKDLFGDIKKAFIKMISDMIARNMMQGLMGGGGGGGFGLGSLFGGGGGGGGGGAGGAAGFVGGGAGMLGGLGGLLPMAGIGLGTGILQSDAGESTGGGFAGGALAGAGLGATFGSIIPGIGTVIGAIAGGLIGGIGGAISGKDSGDKEEKQKEAAEQAAQQQQADLQAQKERAAQLLKTQIQTNLGGGLATPESAEAVSQLFSGDVTAGDIDQFGGPQGILSREGEILAGANQQAGMKTITIGSPNITVTAQINSSYDVQNLAQDLGYYLTSTVPQSAGAV